MTNVDLVRLAGSRGRLSESRAVDPVTAEVVRGGMETVCFEMAEYVSRTATTPILNQSNERNATVLDASGRLAALSVGIPQFMLTSTLPVRFALEFLGVEEFREGDVFVANDPYHGGGHLPDYNVFAPVFADAPASAGGGRRMVLIASIQCHHGDTGGGVPGGYNVTATDIWGEGVRWPVVKVIDRGVERRDVLYALQANNRIPSYIGDLRAQIGSAQLGARRLGEIIDRYGAETVEASVDSMIDYAARRFREEVALWPDGEYEADAYVDHDPLGNPDVHLHVKVTVAGDALTIDFTGSDARPELQAWSTYGNTRGYTVGQIASMMDPEIPKNEGFFEQIKLVVPKGCVLNPDANRPVSAGTHHPGADVGEVIAVAMQHVLPERAVPQTYKTGIPTIITGVDPRTGASFTDHSAEVYAGWCNASKGMDAWGALNASFGNLWKATAEINESLYPHIQWSRDYRTDSGGPGEWRGICGSHYEKEVLVDAKVYTYVVGMKYPMPGICGGRNGSPNEMIIRYGSDDPFRVEHTANWVPMQAGDRIMYDYGGGGGWGDPLVRDPQAVLDDVLDEYVSVDGARRDYGVVLTGSLDDLTLALDEPATEQLRAEIPRRFLMGYRIGVDVGGTFTDLICVTPSGEIVLDKTPSTLDDQSRGVMNGLAQLADRFGLSLSELCAQLEILVHGTTTADNTMIEMNGAPTGLLVTEGHRDEIELRRCHKEQIWDPNYPGPTPIARRRARVPIRERMDHTGKVVLPLDEAAVRRGVQRLKQLGVRSIAVMYLFSFVNSEHERRTREIVLEEFPDVDHVSLSHEVMPRGPEFERVSTTLVNAYVAPRIAHYTGHLQDELRRAGYGGPLLIMQSTGGVMPPDYVARRAVTLLASGPTGGVMGATLAAGRADVGDFVAVDMGGTSFDICLVRHGQPQIKTDWNWRYRYYIGLPMVDVQSVGAGGGSIARVRQGALLVGPESAGSTPGPACYGRGGDRPTVTDADAVLGYLPVDGFAGGRMQLDVAAAEAAIRGHIAEPLGSEVLEAAWGIQRIVNANMANATRKVLASHGADARDLSLIAYGGNGAVHACAIARELGISKILVPKAAPAFSALGVLVADYVVDLVRSYVTPLSQVDLGRVHTLMSELDGEVTKELEPAGLDAAETVTTLYVQMCYPGQNFDMSVPVPEGIALDEPGLLDLAERFHNQHEAERGFCFHSQQPLVRGVRVTARGFTPKPDHFAEAGAVRDAALAASGTRRAYWGEWVDTPVYDGTQLGTGARIDGPALIEEPFTVVVLPPNTTAELDPLGNYVIELS